MQRYSFTGLLVDNAGKWVLSNQAEAAIKERDQTIAEVWSILTGWDAARLTNNSHTDADDPRAAVIAAAKRAAPGYNEITRRTAERDDARQDASNLRHQLKQLQADGVVHWNAARCQWEFIKDAPVEPETELAAVLNRVRRLERWVADPGLSYEVRKEIVADVKAGR